MEYIDEGGMKHKILMIPIVDKLKMLKDTRQDVIDVISQRIMFKKVESKQIRIQNMNLVSLIWTEKTNQVQGDIEQWALFNEFEMYKFVCSSKYGC